MSSNPSLRPPTPSVELLLSPASALAERLFKAFVDCQEIEMDVLGEPWLVKVYSAETEWPTAVEQLASTRPIQDKDRVVRISLRRVEK